MSDVPLTERRRSPGHTTDVGHICASSTTQHDNARWPPVRENGMRCGRSCSPSDVKVGGKVTSNVKAAVGMYEDPTRSCHLRFTSVLPAT